MKPNELLLKFAADFSGGDVTVLTAVKAAIEKPPRDPETLGFYPFPNSSDAELATRRTLTLLREREHLASFEDKYIYEMVHVLLESGTVPEGKVTAAQLAVLDGTALAEKYDGEDPMMSDDPPPVKNPRESFVPATQALEQAIAATGKRLVSIEVPLGDSLFFAFVSPEVADCWLNVKLVDTANSEFIAVRAPLWDRYWKMLLDAVGIVDAVVAPPEDLPSRPPLRKMGECD
jgi:hypothetical protein